MPTSPPGEIEPPVYSPASPASPPTPASATARNYNPGAKSPEYHPGHVATTYQGHVAAPEYPGAISASIMGPLAASNMYPGGTFDGFFAHLVNLLSEVVDGIRTRAKAGIALFAYDDAHYAMGADGLIVGFNWSTPIYMAMLLFTRASGSVGGLILFIIVVFMVPTVQAAPCPTCSDSLPGCTFSTNARACPFIASVAANTAIVAGGVGALNIAGLLKPRFMRLFSKVAFETLLALVRRRQPGTVFEINDNTKLPDVLNAVSNGLLTMEHAVLRFCELIEDAATDPIRATLTRRLDNLKSACDIHHKAGDGSLGGLFEAGC